jgi:Relaxase/Mobilisation nuclease domain
MIAKGASRNNPRQLAVYLMRVERYDTGEPAELLELQSGWAASLGPDSSRPRIASRLIEAFRDWQLLTEGTKQGRDGLYHAEISPEAHYAATMTPEQWLRAADLQGEELGLQGQPRAVVLHGGTDGRKHLHVVWARTDIEAMKLVSDSYNFVAHERASKRMEEEFGHDFVPGKHAKRDRERQPEFPRQKLSQDEDQWQKRTGLSVEDRKAEIAALHSAADSPQAFKAALEEAGYLLANGDRGYIVVDQLGGHSLLSRNIGLPKKEAEAFMAGVDLNKLPTIEEAKALQKEARARKRTESPADAKGPSPEASPAQAPPEKASEPPQPAEKPSPQPIELAANSPKETSKFLSPEAPARSPDPAQKIEPPAPVSGQVPPRPINLSTYSPKAEPEKVIATPSSPTAPKQQPTPTPEAAQPKEDPAIAVIKAALTERQQKEARQVAEKQAAELRQREFDLTIYNAGRIEAFDRILAERAAALRSRQQEQKRPGFQGMLDDLKNKGRPEIGAEKAEAQRIERQQLDERQRQERAQFIAMLEQSKKLELENLRDRHALQWSDRDRRNEEELERYISEQLEAKRIAQDMEADRLQRERDEHDELRDGPPPPLRGK